MRVLKERPLCVTILYNDNSALINNQIVSDDMVVFAVVLEEKVPDIAWRLPDGGSIILECLNPSASVAEVVVRCGGCRDPLRVLTEPLRDASLLAYRL